MNIKREDIFIITKIATYNHADKCYESILKSREDLGLDYIDMVLIHWPGVKGLKLDDQRNFDFRKKTYLELERAYNDGIIKSIGVSNYTIRHIQELFSYCSIKPQLLQCEFHPLLIQRDIVEFCRQNSIIFQAYSSLGTSDPESTRKLVQSEKITHLAQKYAKTPAQILLKWAIQKNIAVIPKSTSEVHLKDNMNIFDFNLDELDMLSIDNMNENLHLCWNSETVL
ncbi:glyoxal reductase-like [Brachionus plicatilis]|uniref:Glyoxal reductase-like n=1 Tax=Brachionus plicatilis TaxID=10195 RepID=A0A3M7QU23_BRAPC|nr:glyoxal reductase-like [Brachionus plicatilis]